MKMTSDNNEEQQYNYQGDGNTKSTQKARPQIEAMEKGPGPAVYQLRQNVVFDEHGPTKRRNPAWSMSGKYGKFTDDASPGPKYGLHESLTNKGIQRSKSFTMSARNRALKNLMSDTPGPGSNSPQVNFMSHHKKAPQWVMGERSAFRLGDNNPAPNTYGLPELLGTGVPNKASSASFSLHNRTKVGSHDEDLGQTPGPAAYGSTDNNLVYKRKPRWTMSARAKNMSALMKNPAPNAYGPRGFVDKKAAPKFSMGVKHSEYCMPLIIDAWD